MTTRSHALPRSATSMPIRVARRGRERSLRRAPPLPTRCSRSCPIASTRDSSPRARALSIVACALKGFDNFDVEACTEARRLGHDRSRSADRADRGTRGRRSRSGLDAKLRAGRRRRALAAQFEGWRPILYGTGLDGAIVGVVGMGAVGRAIAGRLAGFGCRFLGVDPTQKRRPASRSRTRRALAASDFLILAVPLTRDTPSHRPRRACAG